MQEMEQIDKKRSVVQAQTNKIDENFKDIQTQINVSQNNENTHANMLVDSHTELNHLQSTLQDYQQSMEAKKRAIEECSMYQARLNQVHRAHESYVKEKRQYLHDTEQQLLQTRRSIEKLHNEMEYQNQLVHHVQCGIDDLLDRASYLDTQISRSVCYTGHPTHQVEIVPHQQTHQKLPFQQEVPKKKCSPKRSRRLPPPVLPSTGGRYPRRVKNTEWK